MAVKRKSRENGTETDLDMTRTTDLSWLCSIIARLKSIVSGGATKLAVARSSGLADIDGRRGETECE
ncbi:hypothetical protein NL676_026921 [Syzygium grande]|nr:hypothetical protein NL676_026921 [Syzygium grande]